MDIGLSITRTSHSNDDGITTTIPVSRSNNIEAVLADLRWRLEDQRSNAQIEINITIK